MYKSIVLAVSLCLFAAFSYADEQFITIHHMVPANGAIISECPTFTWSRRRTASGTYVITVMKNGESTPVIRETVGEAKYEINPHELDKFLTLGDYTWFVSTDEGDKSLNQTFSVKALSCVPPKADNKIDNSFNKFTQQDSKTPNGNVVSSPWKKDDEEPMKVNTKNVVFYPLSGEKIFALKIHESYVPGATTNPPDELEHSVAQQQIKPDIGDNIIAFRYIYFTTGNSTVHVEVQEPDDHIIYLGCIGTTPDPNQGVECRPDSKDSEGHHFSPGIRVTGDEKPTWDLFNATIPPRKTDDMITVRLRYQRAFKSFNDSYAKNNANYVFFVSEFTFGQCSSVRDDYYDPEDTANNLNKDCPSCDSAGMKIPKNYTSTDPESSHCFKCTQAGALSYGKCASVSYCTACQTSYKCEDASTSKCREQVNCSSKTKNECKDDCVWCGLDSKCVFYSDAKSSCTTCASLSDSTSCNAKSSCGWCPTLQICLEEDDPCPSCDFISKGSCSYEATDGACQYCNAQGKCLNTDVVCDAQCGTYTTESICDKKSDCHWCISTNNCTEKRIGCPTCESLQSDQCEKSKYPGCTLCDTLFCTSDPSKCPVCSSRTIDNCEFEGKIRLNCQYCNSSLKCLSKKEECKSCSGIENVTECKALRGCSFCNSEQVCKSADDTLTECDCLGLSATACATHTKGCCWSSKNTKCYDVGDDNCGGGDVTTIIVICVAVGVVVAIAAVLIPILVCCCKPKSKNDIEMTAPGTIVVLPEGQPSMVVAQESLQSVNVDPATAVSIDETSVANGANGIVASTSMQDMQNMQNMIAQQQMLNTMMAQQQMSMMMNPMMMNSMGSMNMMNMSGMAGMSGMNSMGMDMNSMNMTGGMSGMGSMNMTGGMANMTNSMQGDNSMQNGAMQSQGGQM